MAHLVISIDVTLGTLPDAARHDAELSAILQQAHSAMVMRALPQELYDTNGTVVGVVLYQENMPTGGRMIAEAHARQAAGRASADPKAAPAKASPKISIWRTRRRK